MCSKGTFEWSGKRNINEVIVAYGFTKIGENAFRNSSSLANITIPNSVTNIGKMHFLIKL